MNRKIIIMMMLEVVDWGRKYNDGISIVIRWLYRRCLISMLAWDFTIVLDIIVSCDYDTVSDTRNEFQFLVVA